MFKNYAKSFEKAGLSVMGDQVITRKGDVVAVLDGYGDVHTKDAAVLSILEGPVDKVAKPKKASKED